MSRSPAPDHHPDLSRWRRFVAAMPMRISLLAVGVVWLLGCTWSFQEQTEFAASKAFAFPHLLPLVIDGFAVSMAGVSWAASLDARPALPARLATLVAVASSSASNGTWAYLRAHHDMVAVALGMAVPIAANMAFEVLLAELRRQVQRRRGLPAPVAVPYPRLIRLILAPVRTVRSWRATVLTLTDPSRLTSEAATDQNQMTAPPPPKPLPSPPTTEVDTAVILAPAPSKAAQPPPDALPPSPRRHEHQPSTVRAIGTPSPLRLARPPAAAAAPAAPPRGSRAARAAELAEYLRLHGDSKDITGENVGELLGIEIAARTGRRLLLMARELLDNTAHHPTDLDHPSPAASAVGR